MVFESLVVEMINRYLGQFVENLDKSQLSIGIFSAKQGDIVLKKLSLKESALDNFHLPLRIKAGHLGKLTLKIPWKNLYTEPTSIHIQNICILALHNIAIKYDSEEDRKAKLEEKQARLAQIDIMKKWEQEKDKASDPKQDSFVEKLATRIIKNLQIKISGIHIRYEDTYTNPQRPFSIGFTLQELVFQTTGSNWKETVIKEDVSQIYKLIRLDSLSLYWNSRSDLLQDKNNKQILTALEESIPKQGSRSQVQYLIQPISAVAHLRLNTKPELMNLSLPKIQLTLVFDEITIMMLKDQYDDILEMLEAIERMNLRNKYKETRPTVPYKNNAKKWWHHAYSIILKHTVQRRRNMWKWNNIKKHRENLKIYRELYTQKFEGKKLGKTELSMMEKIEEELDVFNICICRNQAELEVARLDKKRATDKFQMAAWFDSWFGREKEMTADFNNVATPVVSTEFNDKFNQEFTDDEKAKLYKAIGYDEKAKDPTYPTEYVSVRMVIKLNKLSFVLLGEKKSKDHLLKLILTEICASFGQRPAANAIRFDVKMDQLRAVGFPRSDYLPKLINSVGVSKEANISLLTLSFETNPINATCDTRVRVQSSPLEIIYDAITVNSLVIFFRPPESVKLKQLSYAAMARYDEIISQTTAGVVYLMSERKYADIDVHLMPSYIIVPETGELRKDVSMLLLNLGSLSITSEKTKEMPAGAQMSPKELAGYAYDKFNFSLDNVQLLYVQPGDTWKEENQSVNSPLYILRPLCVQLLLEKCLFASDPNLPQFQVSGELPLIAVTVSDNKLLAIMNLIQSIPLPAPPLESKEFVYDEDEILDSSRMTTLDLTRLSRVHPHSKFSEFTNLTQLSVTFIVKEVSFEIRETVNDRESPFLQFIMTRIGVHVKARTSDMSLEVILGGIYLKHLQYKISEDIRQQLKKCQVITGENVNILNSPFVDKNEPLLTIRFIQANKRGPDFKTTYNSTLQSITVEFSTLDVVLHQGVILSLMDFAKKLEPAAVNDSSIDVESLKKMPSKSSIMSQKSEMPLEKPRQQLDILQLKVKALVDSIQLGICNAKCVIMHSRVEGIEFGIGMQNKALSVSTVMRKIEVIDPDPKTFHPKIFSVRGTDMLKLEIIHFTKEKGDKRLESINSMDVILSLKMGRARILFVNKFVMSIMHFFDNFIVAKAKLDEASRAVREASRDVAKNLQEKIPCVKLDVMIKAPLIVVPQNSKSPSVLNIHLGDVSVQNNFEHGNIRSKTRSNLVWAVENLVVKLTNLCISRGFVQSEFSSVTAEISILEPLTFTVDIRRNLSSGYFHAIPDVEVKAILEKIDVKMNQEDIKLLMQIVTENVDERYADGPTSAKARLVIVHNDRQHETPRRFSTTSIISKMSETPHEVHCTFKMDFQLLAINIELYRGIVNLLQANTAKSPDKLLTYLTLKMMRVLISIKSDTSMAATVYLHDISMDDCRSEMAGGTTKLLRRTAFKSLTRAALKVRDKEDELNMAFHITFDQNSTKDKTIIVHICSLHLCLCTKFLMSVAEFFLKALPVKDPDEETEIAHEVKAILEHKDAVNHFKEAPEMEGSINLKLKMEKPEIYLIEDQMNPHTDSLIINLELILHVYMSAHVLNVNGGLSRFSLISCFFEKENNSKKYFKYFKWTPDKSRKISSTEKELLEICYSYYEQKWKKLPFLNYVLTPVDITIIGSGTQNKEHHVDIIMTDFVVTITPSTVHFLTAISSHMTVSSDTDIVVPKQKDYSQIWNKRKLADCDYWFTQSVLDAGSTLGDKKMSRTSSLNELSQTITILYIKEKFLKRKVRYYGNQLKEMLPRFMNLIIYAPVIVLKLEGGPGNRTIPLLIVESSISGQIHNWTSEVYMKCIMGVEVAYNNENAGVWEPVIEPVLDTKSSTNHKWNLSVELVKNPYDDGNDGDNLEESVLPPAKMTINITAVEPLQFVLSKTCLKVLHQLKEAYSEAYQTEYEGTFGQQIFPYQFKNRLGRDLTLIPDSSFELAPGNGSVDASCFPSGKDLHMNIATKKVGFRDNSIIQSEQPVEKKITFQVVRSNVTYDMYIKQAKKRVFTFNMDKVVVSVEAFIGQKIITFTSILQIKNNLNVPIEIKYEDNENSITSAGEVYPYKVFHVPLAAISSSTGVLLFQPKTEENCFLVSKGLEWKTITEKTMVIQIACQNIKKEKPPYYFNVLPEFEKIYWENTDERTDQMIILHLHPTIICHNLLPFSIQISLENTDEMHTLEPGHNIPLNHACVEDSVLQIKILMYQDCTWTGQAYIHHNLPELNTLTFESNEDGKSMDLGLCCKENEGSLDVTVYSPYWIVNLTDLDIALKENDKDHPHVHNKDDKSVMLFYFRDRSVTDPQAKGKAADNRTSTCCSGCRKCVTSRKKFFKRHRKVSLKVADAEWSDKFSLDTVGNSGRIVCKHSIGNTLEVGVKIALTSSGLTKVVTFTPYYLLINASNTKLSVREVQNFTWINLDPGECQSFYPESAASEIMIVAKVQISTFETVPFLINKAHTTLLRLDDIFGGINAECQVSESAMITTFRTYVPGMATVLFVNNTSVFTILIKQITLSGNELILEPQTSVLYTWTAPAAKRQIVWSCGDKKNITSTLDRDEIREYSIQKSIQIFCVSFLNGMQRVVMFTEDLTLATLAQEAGEFEQADQEINLRICEVGFSLINNDKMVEVAYLAITSSGVVWEEKKTRFKAIKQKDAEVFENAYQKYILGHASNSVSNSYVRLDNNVEVDFQSMKVIKPHEYAIKRSFEDGIWMQMRMSPHSMQFHAKINRLQFDNQLRDCVFPTILSPITPPRSVAADRVRKPFIEVSLTIRIHKHRSLLQIKYFKILIQEMNLQIDHSFISGVLSMIASDVHTIRERELSEFKADIAHTQRELREEAGVSMLAKRESFFDYFHISPIKIHLSFSLQGGSLNPTHHPLVLDVFLQSVGVVLTDVHDVVFKLGYFEKNYAFSDNSKMTREFIIHYSRQAIKQMYVLVLGLDVLGNPFGLLRGLTEGIEDLFYEPYQGAIQGPREFAEGLVLGIRSLFGHTVGGTAGAISRIVGTLGEGLAALTLDDEYQRRRREQYRKVPTSAREGFARGGKEMVMGVYEGVTGIIRQPIVGARQAGFPGFLKGIGKGMVGVIIKPTSGVMDFVSMSLEGIRRITDITEEVQHLRPPRMFSRDGVIRPYIYQEAEGYNLMQETDKGKYIDTDEYIIHIKVKENNKLVFIVTDKRIMLAKREIFGSWSTEWMFTYEELADSPNDTSRGIEIFLKEKERRKLCGSYTSKKEVPIADHDIAQAVVAKIAETMRAKYE